MTVDRRRAERDVWVTALSVDEALVQIGLRAPGVLVSADRSREIPLKGFSLDVRTRKTISLLDGGKLRRYVTNAVAVGDLLREMKVPLRKQDKLSLPAHRRGARTAWSCASPASTAARVTEDQAIAVRRGPPAGQHHVHRQHQGHPARLASASSTASTR